MRNRYYHVSFVHPEFGLDACYVYASSINDARRSFYRVNGVRYINSIRPVPIKK
jgi:hypothetical protein